MSKGVVEREESDKGEKDTCKKLRNARQARQMCTLKSREKLEQDAREEGENTHPSITCSQPIHHKANS